MRRGISTMLAVAITGALAFGVSACGDSDNDATTDSAKAARDDNLTFAVITHGNAGSSGFWAVYKNGADQAAKDMGVTAKYSEAALDAQKQAQLIDAAITQKVDGIATTVPDPAALKGALNNAKRAGIPVVLLNSSASGAELDELGGAITSVGQNEIISGRAAGARIKELGAKKVLCLIHGQGWVGGQQRCQGVKEGFGGDVDNLQIATTDDPTTEQAQIKSKLEADSSYDFVVALDTTVATAGAVPAIKGSGSQAKLATFDLSPDVVDDIKDGTIEFAIDQQQYLQPYLGIVTLALYKRNANEVGGGQPVLTGPSFVDDTNVDRVAELVAQATR